MPDHTVAQPEYRPMKQLAFFLQIWIALVALVEVIGTYSKSLVDGFEASNLKNIAALLNITGNLCEILAIVGELVSLVLIITWMRRAIRNVPTLNVQDAKNKDWFAFSFLIPYANHFLPMFLLQE